MYRRCMQYDWDPGKNERLKKERGISFEQILFHLAEGDIWKTAPHPDQVRYTGQRIYFVNVDEYIYLVPHVIQADCIFLKTIIPSRKATRDYRRENHEEPD
jgi:uncharacterized DUF497 family protein